MKTATLREAQHHLSKLVKEVEKGEELTIGVFKTTGKQGLVPPSVFKNP